MNQRILVALLFLTCVGSSVFSDDSHELTEATRPAAVEEWRVSLYNPPEKEVATWVVKLPVNARRYDSSKIVAYYSEPYSGKLHVRHVSPTGLLKRVFQCRVVALKRSYDFEKANKQNQEEHLTYQANVIHVEIADINAVIRRLEADLTAATNDLEKQTLQDALTRQNEFLSQKKKLKSQTEENLAGFQRASASKIENIVQEFQGVKTSLNWLLTNPSNFTRKNLYTQSDHYSELLKMAECASKLPESNSHTEGPAHSIANIGTLIKEEYPKWDTYFFAAPK